MDRDTGGHKHAWKLLDGDLVEVAAVSLSFSLNAGGRKCII